MDKDQVKVLPIIISGSFSFILANFGMVVIKKLPDNPYLGISIIIIAFILLYLSNKLIEIKENKEKIKELGENIEKMNDQMDLQGKLLNTLSNIVILKSVNKNGEKLNL